MKWYFLSSISSSPAVLGDSSSTISACCPKKRRKLVERVNLSTDEFIISMTGSLRAADG
uniref:Uncharacterized protein n=1 Tax=Arundo donax TaxID=35708 RepID=A0A0A9D449_ARUDO